MITSKSRKAVLLSAVLLSLSGMTAFADSPDRTAAPGGMTQSAMINVNTGRQAGASGQIADETAKDKAEASVAVQQSPQTVAVGDASLYLSKADDEAIEAQVGKTITSVDFAGIPEEVKTKLSPLVQSKPGTQVTEEGIRNDVASLGSTGVFSQITPAFNAVPEGVGITYQLAANPVVHDVTFTGNTIFTSDYLKSVMNIPQDSVLNFVLVNQKLKEIENLYLKQGYMLVSIPSVNVSADGTLHVDISEGVVEDIVIVGNEKTKEKVITRELKLKKGKPFNKFQASRSMERLYNLGYFEDVNMKLLPGKENEHNVIIEIDVIEQKTGIVTVGAGYSDSDGTVGIVELGDTNFRGTGDKVNFHWEFGGAGDGKNYTISYTHPWINDNGDSLGGSIFNRIYEYDDYDAKGHEIAEYDKRRKGWNLTWGHVSDEYRTNYFNFESSKESYDDHDGFEWQGHAEDKFNDFDSYGYTSKNEMKAAWKKLFGTTSAPPTALPLPMYSITAITTSMPARAAGSPFQPSGAVMVWAATMISTSLPPKAVSTRTLAAATSWPSVSWEAILTVTFPTAASSIWAAPIRCAAMKMTSSKVRKCTPAPWNTVSPLRRRYRAYSLPMWAVPGVWTRARFPGTKMMILSTGQWA